MQPFRRNVKRRHRFKHLPYVVDFFDPFYFTAAILNEISVKFENIEI